MDDELYSEEGVLGMLEDGDLDGSDAGFMLGYLSA